MDLIDIVGNQISEFDSAATVSVDRAYDTVSIEDLSGEQEDIFMQGDEAAGFIERADELYVTTQCLTLAECYSAVAYDYLNIWG